MAAHHRLGPVIDDHRWHATKVGERPPVAVPERPQVLRGGDVGHDLLQGQLPIRQCDADVEHQYEQGHRRKAAGSGLQSASSPAAPHAAQCDSEHAQGREEANAIL